MALTPQENDDLTRVGPGTPCGTMMRRYWHPVGFTAELKGVGSSRVDLQACKLEYSIVSPK